jgi:hypothetical protein
MWLEIIENKIKAGDKLLHVIQYGNEEFKHEYNVVSIENSFISVEQIKLNDLVVPLENRFFWTVRKEDIIKHGFKRWSQI